MRKQDIVFESFIWNRLCDCDGRVRRGIDGVARTSLLRRADNLNCGTYDLIFRDNAVLADHISVFVVTAVRKGVYQFPWELHIQADLESIGDKVFPKNQEIKVTVSWCAVDLVRVLDVREINEVADLVCVIENMEPFTELKWIDSRELEGIASIRRLQNTRGEYELLVISPWKFLLCKGNTN